MKLNILFFLCLTFLSLSTQVWAQNRVQISIPSVAEEAQYVWRTIQDIQQLEQYDYTIHLPKGELIDELIEKVKNNKLPDSDYEVLEAFMTEQVYQREDYQKASAKIKAQKDLINSMINQLIRQNTNWDFRDFALYEVRLTLYGTGGSYNPNSGVITLWTNIEGKFMQYINPANTIIHEVVHIGIEKSIIEEYKVPHPLKERIVDRIVMLYFEKLLPNYRVQNMGDERIDAYLSKKGDFRKLDNIVKKFLKK